MHPVTIGPFQIQHELGRGGMGEVYLARDTRLDRLVAIKALPAHLLSDPDRLARFEREAKVLASLNHPGIGAIYGLEEANGQQHLILEFVDGETLADRLAQGAIPIEESLAVARQIAEALEAAHEKGVVHRDLKPGNVMVTADGAAKVLDFGLARTADGPPPTSSAPAAPNSPTLPSPAPIHSPTVPGVIMGSVGYMSPEQARGKAVDKRSDIFSFGCVLFEMLSGAAPFSGETATDSLGAILHRDPDWSMLPPRTPARIRDLLGHCLAKDRRNRLHDIGDARLEIDRAIAGREWAALAADAPVRGGPLRPVAAALAAAALLGAGWLLATLVARPEPPAPARTFHVSTTVPARPELGRVVGIAPDARFVLYDAWPELAAESTTPAGVLVVRRLDRDETTVIEGSEGVIGASLSPDGRWVAFAAAKDRARRKIALKKIALDDGRPIGAAETLCDLAAGGAFELCWSSDREIIIAAAWDGSILAAPASGGEPRVVLRGEPSKEIDNWGEVRPLEPGKSILASRWSLVGNTIKERTEIVDLVTGARTPLLENAGGTQMVEGGLLVARRSLTSLVAARFDPAARRIIGEPFTVWSGKLGGAFFVSSSGALALTTRSGDFSERSLAWLDEQGQPRPAGAPPRAYTEIAVAPGGGRVAFRQESADASELDGDIWIYDLARRTFNRLATPAGAWQFVWSRDGDRIVHSSVAKEEFSLWERRTDGSGDAVKIHATGSPQILAFPEAWSPDEKTLAIVAVDLSGNNSEDVLMLEPQPGSEPWKAAPYLRSPAGEHGLTFSPDGAWVTFCSTESGRHELYAQRFTGAANGADDARSGRVQISTSGNAGAAWWSPDGKEIRYVDLDRQVMSVQVQTEPRFSASLPAALYGFKDLKTTDYVWSPDGRIMVVLQGENERPNRIDLVLNFTSDIRAKLARLE